MNIGDVWCVPGVWTGSAELTQAFDVWYLLIPGTPGLRFEKNGVRIALIVRCSKVASTNEFDAAAMRGQLSLAFRVLAPRSVTVAKQLTKLSDSSPFTRKHLGSSTPKASPCFGKPRCQWRQCYSTIPRPLPSRKTETQGSGNVNASIRQSRAIFLGIEFRFSRSYQK